jgi:SAM-dependent methyltransferase
MADCSTAVEFGPADPHPRKRFDDAVEYSVNLSRQYLEKLGRAGVPLHGLRFFEIGPGSDFAPQLVLASHGVDVTLADKYLAAWDPDYHPGFYEAFLKRWTGPADAIKAVLTRGGYAGVLKLVSEPSEKLLSIRSNSFDFVLSNAVLEHVGNIHRAAAELARVTRPGGVHGHQVDFRYHASFDRPLDHLLRDWAEFKDERDNNEGGAVHGTMMRLPEMIESFTPYFWIWGMEANMLADPRYTAEIRDRLPESSPYKYWPIEMLRQTSGFIWLTRKDQSRKSRYQPRWNIRLGYPQ